MIVKEILLNALANAGHIHDGESSESDELNLALRLFNTEMKFYSGKNLVTAYQSTIDIDESKAEQVIGKYNVKNNKRVYEVDSVPSGTGAYVKDRDYLFCNGIFYGIAVDASGAKTWEHCDNEVVCDYFPDVYCGNMERIVCVMYKGVANRYEKLSFVPLTQFYTEDNDYTYCTSAAGENKVKLLVTDYIVGRPLKVIYNTNMNFKKNDNVELPDNHIALLELAVTVALLRHDADSDPTRFNNYKAQLDEVVNNIEATTVTERRIMRSGYSDDDNLLQSGRFITRKFRR